MIEIYKETIPDIFQGHTTLIYRLKNSTVKTSYQRYELHSAMKIFFQIFCIFISSIIQGQTNLYNDWFDLNLKNKPQIVKELSTISFNSFTDPKFKSYLNSTVNQMISIIEYHFDSSGLISKEFQKNLLDTIGDWIEYREYFKYKDSIIVKGYSTVGACGFFQEKRILDKIGYMVCKTILMDTIQYLRNSKNRIKRTYEHLIGIDSPEKREKEFEYNDNGDVIKENSRVEAFLASESKPVKSTTVTTYKYIYDSYSNWIIRLQIIDNEIISISQRQIKYR